MSTSFNAPSFVAGLSTGLRALTATSVTLATDKSPWTGLAGTLAAGELFGDKLPIAPARTGAGGLIARAGMGALCGSMLARRNGRSPRLGALAGAVGAVATTYGGYNLRKLAVEKLGLPDALVAVAEDGIAFGLARLANA